MCGPRGVERCVNPRTQRGTAWMDFTRSWCLHGGRISAGTSYLFAEGSVKSGCWWWPIFLWILNPCWWRQICCPVLSISFQTCCSLLHVTTPEPKILVASWDLQTKKNEKLKLAWLSIGFSLSDLIKAFSNCELWCVTDLTIDTLAVPFLFLCSYMESIKMGLSSFRAS